MLVVVVGIVWLMPFRCEVAVFVAAKDVDIVAYIFQVWRCFAKVVAVMLRLMPFGVGSEALSVVVFIVVAVDIKWLMPSRCLGSTYFVVVNDDISNAYAFQEGR